MQRAVTAVLGIFVVLATGAQAQIAQNVFVVVVDGMRNMEAFESESLYTRHIWNDLRPIGTINKRFWNRGWTATTGGHTTILSGVRQILINNGSNPQEVRSFDPLMFEYYRKAFAAPESSCGVIVGKWGNVGDIANYGLEPSYGSAYEGFQRGDTSTSEDTACSRLVHSAMDSLHPRLVLVNLGDVDHYGHIDSLGGILYQQAIRDADSIVYEFWKHIQAIPPYTDTSYRDKTVLIVTSDHGRHDDAHGGFPGHGNWDHGCRHIMFLAAGPGIAQDRAIEDVPRDHIDIVPTIAQILGFPAPFSEGKVMDELFEGAGQPQVNRSPGGPPIPFAVNLSNSSGFSRDPDIARDRSGNLYCVWSDNSPGKWSVLYRRSSDNGLSWLPVRSLFDYPESDSQMWFARVAADDSVAVAAMGYGKATNWLDPARTQLDTTFIWYPWIATSADAGNSWSTTSLLDSSMGSYYAPIAVKNGRYSVAWWACGQFTPDTNGVYCNRRGATGLWQPLPARVTKKNSIHMALADDGANYHLAATIWQTKDWDVAYYRSTTGDSWTQTWLANDPQGSPNYDYDPELAVDHLGRVHVVWARKPNSGGAWRIMHGHRDSSAGSFDTTGLITGPADAWQPHIAAKGDTVALVWIDYRDGNSELYAGFSTNRGDSWSTPERITYTDAFTEHPRVAPIDKGFFVVWQDMQTGNWEIYGRQIGPLVGRDAGVVSINSPVGSADSTVLITPSATLQNYGLTTATFRTYFRIQDALGDTAYYESTLVADLAGGGTVVQPFPSWPKPYALGNYSTWCSVSYLGDANPANDLAGGSFTITLPPPAWYAKADFPINPRNRMVRDGACLTFADVRDTNCLYALRGNNTYGFYRYDIAANSWQTRESIPAYGWLLKRKTVKKGGTLASAASKLYATKGNNTLEFWQYDPCTIGGFYPWSQKADVPLGLKTVREGTGAAGVTVGDTTYVYLLKGSSTQEFYRYNTVTNAWAGMASAPSGLSGKPFRNGSCITFDRDDNTIYALKATYNEFYVYRVDSNVWITKTALPLVGSSGRKKKAKDGAGLTYHNGVVYALKGGNTQEFWTYLVDSDRWVQRPDVPLGAGKRVRGGGAIVCAPPSDVLFATKGNNTLEFYMFYPLTVQNCEQRTGSSLQVSSVAALFPYSLRVSPNPFSALATVYYSLPKAGDVSLKLYDVSGKLVQTLASGYCNAGSYAATVRASRLAPLPRGIYLLRFEAGSLGLSQKLILE
jgi:hypothetical protein